MPDHAEAPTKSIQTAQVAANEVLCREHLRLTFEVPALPVAAPGQFVHVGGGAETAATTRAWVGGDGVDAQPQWGGGPLSPLLRRAFSISGLRRGSDGVEVDIIYRVVGRGTQWMSSLKAGDPISVLGPLGRAFPIHAEKRVAYLVAGGVGVPPMLWLAEALARASVKAVAFCGARSADLLPLTLDDGLPAEPARAAMAVAEFAEFGVPAVVSTDDGSAGFAGHVGEAMARYHHAHATPAEDLVVYTCGPERMMRFVADYCAERGIRCYVCMERSMACGMGTCQSCVIAVEDPSDPDGWRYELCCTDGPVFDATRIRWDMGEE